MASIPLFLDLVTGRLRASVTDDREVSMRAIAQNDIARIGLTLVQDGAAVTATTLSGAAFAATLRQPGATTDDTALAQATSATVASEVATFSLDLTGAAIDDYFDEHDGAELQAILEIRITAPATAWRHSWRIPAVIARALFTASPTT